MEVSDPEDEIRKAFGLFNGDNTVPISFANLKKASRA
jgi:Ca2+-binding EF-hand superfamily protein